MLHILSSALVFVGCGSAPGEFDPVDADTKPATATTAVPEPTSNTRELLPKLHRRGLMFAHNTTYKLAQENGDGTTRTIGYVFASPGTSIGVAQEQRWILYDGPGLLWGTTQLGIPEQERQYASLEAWVEAVRNDPFSRSPSATYVKAVTTIHGIEMEGNAWGGCSNGQIIDENRCKAVAAVYDASSKLLAVALGRPLHYNQFEQIYVNYESWAISQHHSPHLIAEDNLYIRIEHPWLNVWVPVAIGSTLETTECEYFIGALPSEL